MESLQLYVKMVANEIWFFRFYSIKCIFDQRDNISKTTTDHLKLVCTAESQLSENN